MPPFSNFREYKLVINYEDHEPPHIHVIKGKRTVARLGFINGEIIILSKEKDFKRSELKVLKAWMLDNIDVLNKNWDNAKHNLPFIKIERI